MVYWHGEAFRYEPSKLAMCSLILPSDGGMISPGFCKQKCLHICTSPLPYPWLDSSRLRACANERQRIQSRSTVL